MAAGLDFHANNAVRQLRQDIKQLIVPHVRFWQDRLACRIDALSYEQILDQMDVNICDHVCAGILNGIGDNIVHDFPVERCGC